MLVGLVLLLSSSGVSIIECDQRYGLTLSAQSWPTIMFRHHISQVIENGLRKPLPIHQT
jgi:hypothetical protein